MLDAKDNLLVATVNDNKMYDQKAFKGGFVKDHRGFQVQFAGTTEKFHVTWRHFMSHPTLFMFLDRHSLFLASLTI